MSERPVEPSVDGAVSSLEREILARVRDVPDYPTPGVLFKDITPLLADPKAFSVAIEALGGPATDGIRPGQRVLLVDDVLATGGTAAAAAGLVQRLGGVLAGVTVLMELAFLAGRQRLGGVDVRALVSV